MSRATLNQIKIFSAAASFYTKRNFASAIRDFTLALEALSKVHPDYQSDLAYIHTQIAKSYAQMGIQKVFGGELKSIDELIASQAANHQALDQFTVHMNQAAAALNGMAPTYWVKAVNRSMTDTKNFLSNRIIDKIKEFLRVAKLARLDKETMQQAIKQVEHFLQQYQRFLVSEHPMYMVAIITFIAESLVADADQIKSTEERIASYQQAIALFHQAAQPLSQFALVKPAEICFHKWIAHEHIAILSKNEKDKITHYESMIEEFKQVFTNQAGGRSDYFYAVRPTPYAYALFYVYKSHLALARLAATEEARAAHAKSAEACQKEFFEMAAASRIIISELPDSHKVNMLIAMNMLAPLAARVKPESKAKRSLIDEDSESDESSDDSEYEEEPVKNTSSKTLSSSSLVSTTLTKRKFATPEPASKNAMSSSSSDSGSDSDEELDNMLREYFNKSQAHRPQAPAAQGPAKKPRVAPTSGSASTGAFFQAAKSSSEHWYSDANILSVLDQRLRAEIDRGEVLVFGCLESQNIFSQINSRCAAQQQQINNGAQHVAKRFIIPMNINRNHWVALSVSFARGFNQPPVVHYADPMQSSIPLQFRARCLASFPGAVLHGSGVVYQNNTIDCGPWVVAISEHLAKTGSFVSRASVNMALRRAADFQYFDERNANANSVSSVLAKR
jgi:hypothetical protein